MKALIVYDNFTAAAKANAALLSSAENVAPTVQWTVRPWRLNMLKFPPTADETLNDAADAHLIVFAGRCAQTFPFWLRHWLEHWAKFRQIKDAALAVFWERSDGVSLSATLELSHFATCHGLAFIFDDSMELVPYAIGPASNSKSSEEYKGWGIND